MPWSLHGCAGQPEVGPRMVADRGFCFGPSGPQAGDCSFQLAYGLRWLRCQVNGAGGPRAVSARLRAGALTVNEVRLSPLDETCDALTNDTGAVLWFRIGPTGVRRMQGEMQPIAVLPVFARYRQRHHSDGGRPQGTGRRRSIIGLLHRARSLSFGLGPESGFTGLAHHLFQVHPNAPRLTVTVHGSGGQALKS